MIFLNRTRYALSHAWVNLSVTIPICDFLLKLTEHANCCFTKGLAWVVEFTSSGISETVSLDSLEARCYCMHLVNWLCPLACYLREKAWSILRCRVLCRGLRITSGQRISTMPFLASRIRGIHWRAVREADSVWQDNAFILILWGNGHISHTCLPLDHILPNLRIRVLW